MADPAGASTLHVHEEYKLVTVLCCGLAGAPALAAQLATAIDFYRAMEMTFWLP